MLHSLFIFLDFFHDLSGVSDVMQCLFTPFITHSAPLDLEQKQIEQLVSGSVGSTNIASRTGKSWSIKYAAKHLVGC